MALHDDGSAIIHGDIFIGRLRPEKSLEVMGYSLANQAFVKRFHSIEQFDSSAVSAHLEVKGSDAEFVDHGAGDDAVNALDHTYS